MVVVDIEVAAKNIFKNLFGSFDNNSQNDIANLKNITNSIKASDKSKEIITCFENLGTGHIVEEAKNNLNKILDKYNKDYNKDFIPNYAYDKDYDPCNPYSKKEVKPPIR